MKLSRRSIISLLLVTIYVTTVATLAYFYHKSKKRGNTESTKALLWPLISLVVSGFAVIFTNIYTNRFEGRQRRRLKNEIQKLSGRVNVLKINEFDMAAENMLAKYDAGAYKTEDEWSDDIAHLVALTQQPKQKVE